MDDMVLICRDCGKEFVFRVEDQIFFAQNGWANPIRCRDCQRVINRRRTENEKYDGIRDSMRRDDIPVSRDAKRSPVKISGTEFNRVDPLYREYNDFEKEWRNLDLEQRDPSEI